MKKQNIYAQGDILLIKVESIPQKKKKYDRQNGKIILAWGEKTGHHHRIEDDTTQAWVDDNDAVWLEVKDLIEEARVIHEEHGEIRLPEGYYRVIREQRQFQSERGEQKKVED